jgi:hypothetical protein
MLTEREAIKQQTKRAITNSFYPIKFNPYKSPAKDEKARKLGWRNKK